MTLLKKRTIFVDSCFKCEAKAGEKTTSGLNTKTLAEGQIGDDIGSTARLSATAGMVDFWMDLFGLLKGFAFGYFDKNPAA
jgi:hypothetical protein